MSDVNDLINSVSFYQTGEHPCSYREGFQSRTIFLDPEQPHEPELYEALSHLGFRRSGQHLYRPNCVGCRSCISSRVPVQEFSLSRRHRRITNRNKDIKVDMVDSRFRDEDYELFERYINERHADGDMYPPNQKNYADFLAASAEHSHHIRYTLGNQLVGVAVTDRLKTGLSAIYTFFDPDLTKRSLGVFSILTQLRLCEALGLPYLYLGYWIDGCKKMDYKMDYQPIELLVGGQWRAVKQKPTSIR